MTERAVAEQLRDIIVETSESLLEAVDRYGLFAHDPQLGDNRAGQSRRFNIFASSGAKHANHHGEAFSDYRILIDYLDRAGDLFEADRIANADAYVLSARLANPSNWQSGSSTIVHLVPDGDDLLPWSVEEVDVDEAPRRRVTFLFTVIHNGHTPLE